MSELKFRVNLWSGLVAIMIAAIVWILVPLQIPVREKVLTSGFAPDYIPKLATGIIFICGLILVFQSLVLKKDKVISVILRNEGRSLVYYALILLYVIAMPLIGFLFSSILFCIAGLLFTRSKRISHYLATIAIVLIIFFSFKYGLYVNLP